MLRISEQVVNAELDVGKDPSTKVRFRWKSGFGEAIFWVGEEIVFYEISRWSFKKHRKYTLNVGSQKTHNLTVIKTRHPGRSGLLTQEFAFFVDGIEVDASQTSEIAMSDPFGWKDMFIRPSKDLKHGPTTDEY